MQIGRLLELDRLVSSQLRITEQSGLLRSIASVLAHSADSWLWLAGLAVAWFFGPENWRLIELDLAVGILLTAVIVMTIKFSVRRRRPEGEWGQIYRFTDPHSFPSGHAARSFMLAVVLFGFFPGSPAAFFFVWALLVCLARVAMGVHYFSDVFVGALIGILLGAILLAVFQSAFWVDWTLAFN